VGRGVEEEADDARAHGTAGDPTAGLVGVEHGLDPVGLILQIRPYMVSL
jgi:hypothetical protein